MITRLLTSLLLLLPCLVRGQLLSDWNAAAETAIVYNPAFPGSEKLARYYAAKRRIPPERILALSCPQEDSMSRTEYNSKLRDPLRQAFLTKGWWITDPKVKAKTTTVILSTVRILVLMRGVPFQIRRDQQNPVPSKEDEASVDSELTVLAMADPPPAGALKNPYFEQQVRLPQLQGASGLLLVGRLDGPDDDTVMRMIDDAIFTEENGLQGRAVIDLALKVGDYKEGEDWLNATASLYQQNGIPVFIDRSESVLRADWPLPDTAFYFGWYTSDIFGAIASPSFQFRRGAIACHLHSFSASVIRSTDKAWVGPILNKGATATLGNVFEPYLALTVHFDIFNKRLFAGHTLAEAAWSATPGLSWMSVVLGDPLYRPFAKGRGARLGEGTDRDYALYQGAAQRTTIDPDAAIKTSITALAEKRKSPHLLELTALLSELQNKHAEAIELLDHAEALTADPTVRLRLRIYRAEFLRRHDKAKTASRLLQDILADPSFKSLPALEAARSLLNELDG